MGAAAFLGAAFLGAAFLGAAFFLGALAAFLYEFFTLTKTPLADPALRAARKVWFWYAAPMEAWTDFFRLKKEEPLRSLRVVMAVAMVSA